MAGRVCEEPSITKAADAHQGSRNDASKCESLFSGTFSVGLGASIEQKSLLPILHSYVRRPIQPEQESKTKKGLFLSQFFNF